MDFIKVDTFDTIADEFHERVEAMVWCAVATVTPQGLPRTRVLHPIWEGNVGWIGTSRQSPKAKDIDHQPHVSMAYIKDPFKPVYVDGSVEWMDDIDERKRVWELFRTTPEPYGYDPAIAFASLDDFGLLKVTPKRVEVYTLGVKSKIWRA